MQSCRRHFANWLRSEAIHATPRRATKVEAGHIWVRFGLGDGPITKGRNVSTTRRRSTVAKWSGRVWASKSHAGPIYELSHARVPTRRRAVLRQREHHG